MRSAMGHKPLTTQTRKRSQTMNIKHTFHLGKIAYRNPNRKINPVRVYLEMRDTDCGPELAITADISNATDTRLICGGQILHILKGYLNDNTTFLRLYRLWKGYHLNGMHAGTARQTAAVAEWRAATGCAYDYTAACRHLKSIGLYFDTLAPNERIQGRELTDGENYMYGEGWIYTALPEEVKAEIYDLCGMEYTAAA